MGKALDLKLKTILKFRTAHVYIKERPKISQFIYSLFCTSTMQADFSCQIYWWLMSEGDRAFVKSVLLMPGNRVKIFVSIYFKKIDSIFKAPRKSISISFVSHSYKIIKIYVLNWKNWNLGRVFFEKIHKEIHMFSKILSLLSILYSPSRFA